MKGGMNSAWLTLNLEAPDLREVASGLPDCQLELLSEFESSNGPRLELKCLLCDRQLSAAIYSADRDQSEAGHELVRSALQDIVHLPESDEVSLVREHLRRTVSVAWTSKPFDPACDCDFRFHQLVARPDFLWYIEGKGFSDDVEEWLVIDQAEQGER